MRLVRCDPDRRYGLAQLEEMAEALPRRKGGSGSSAGKAVPRDVLGVHVRDGKRNVALASVGAAHDGAEPLRK